MLISYFGTYDILYAPWEQNAFVHEEVAHAFVGKSLSRPTKYKQLEYTVFDYRIK